MRQALTHPRHASTHAAQPPMWMICGDLNTTRGTLLAWKGAYENANDPKEFQIQIHQALEQQNKHGDYMLSQGFSTTHVESTIGASENRASTSATATTCSHYVGTESHQGPKKVSMHKLDGSYNQNTAIPAPRNHALSQTPALGRSPRHTANGAFQTMAMRMLLSHSTSKPGCRRQKKRVETCI